jgi:YebC/PmpR family DNA-binding regulatory protein
MAGHSHWAGIKHKKEIADQKRARLFSKLLNAISIAARQDTNPQFNPRLRAAIDKAKANKVPQENIERAINRAFQDKNLEELIIEAYGPNGIPIMIEAITDNKNRTISEIKKILSDHNTKFAESGSVRWAFELINNESGVNWQAKFKQKASEADKKIIENLFRELENHDDVQNIYTNID